MRWSGVANRVRLASQVLKNDGLIELARRAEQKLRRNLGLYSSDDAPWQRHKREADAAFDRRYGVETGGVQPLFDMTITGHHRDLGNAHIACDPDEFARGIEAMAIDHSRFAFVDLGSGKGRALMLAAAYPFRRIVGVEFARELHEAAQTNVLALPDDSKIELIHGDAADYCLPDGPVALFLYNPFGEELISRVARKTFSSLQDNPREFRVLYLNPLYEVAWSDAGFQVSAKGQGFTIFDLPAMESAALPGLATGGSQPAELTIEMR